MRKTPEQVRKTMDNLSGRTIKSYELRECVGSGGFGAVYRAYQPSIGREVAVKVILPQHANQPDFIRRFEVEAQLIARLEHPHIVPLYDYWRDPDGAFLVMRWLRASLRTAIQRGTWSPESVARLLEQIASALSITHREGIVHRDIKPDNILLDEDDNAYLADFGIAKDLSLRDLTAPGTLVGSPSYITPEQIKGEPITPRADIYTLGLVLYELLVGEKPFPQATTPAELIHKHLSEPLPPLAGRTLPAPLNEVLQTATAKDPSHRYASTLRLAAAFRAALPPLQRHAPQPLAEPLTGRELDILRLMVDGMTNEEIAQKLYLSPGTVKWYVKQIYGKLDAHSRRQAVERAQSLNLIGEPGRASPIGGAGEMADVSTVIGMKEAVEPVNPYKGLRAFQETDADDFFGRAALTERLLARLADGGDSGRFLAVVGPSGSGKSSIVKAGLIPALRRGGLTNSAHWFITEMLPGTHPLEELEAALLRVAVNPIPALLDQLVEDRRGLVRAAKRILPGDPDTDLLLVIDQFEELFTLVEDEPIRTHFLDNLLSAVTDPRSRIHVVLTLRADFYDRPLLYPRLAELIRSYTEVVVPLTPAEMERAIAGPAERVGLLAEDGLVATMVNEVGRQPGALPSLQYALTELYELREGITLTLDAYRASGGITGALARRADEIHESLDDAGQQAARQMFLRLITLGEGTEDTRRRVLLTELESVASDGRAMDDVIETFSYYRLLTFDRDPLTRGPTVEVAHEALIREWGRLRAWLDESRDDIRMQRQLAEKAAEWREANQEASFLVGGLRLEQFERWAAETTMAQTAEERDYLDASIAERERQAQAQAKQEARERSLERRSRNFLRALVAVLALATLGAFGLTGAAVTNADAAERSAEASRSLALAADSQLALNTGNNDLALMLAMQAVNIENPPHRAELALSEAAYTPGSRWQFTDHRATVRALAISPDGHYVATGSGRVFIPSLPIEEDNTIRLLDIVTGQEIQRFVGHADAILAVAFSSDGRYLLSGSADAFSGSPETSIVLWDVETGQQVRRFAQDPDWIVTKVAFVPDGQHFLVYSSFFPNRDDVPTENRIVLWDLETGEPIRDYADGTDSFVYDAGFSPDGCYVYLATGDVEAGDRPEIRVFQVESGEQVQSFTFDLGEETGYYMNMGQDNHSLFVLYGTTGIVWDLQTGEQSGSFVVPSIRLNMTNATLGPDARTLVMSFQGGEVRLQDTGLYQEVPSLLRPAGTVWVAAFTSDGLQLLTGGESGVRLWDLQPGAFVGQYGTPEGVPIFPVKNLVFMPDGRSFFSLVQRNRTLTHYDLETGDLITRYVVKDDEASGIWGLDISLDGRSALIGVQDGTAVHLDLSTGTIIRELVHVPDPSSVFNTVSTVDISPDGRTALTGSQDTSDGMVLWDLETGDALHHFETSPTGALALAFSPDGHSAISASSGDGTVILWDMQTYQEIRRFADGDIEQVGATFDLAFSSDGRFLLTASTNGTLTLWDVAARQALRRLVGHSTDVRGVSFSPDGTMAVSASSDGVIILWDVATGQAIRQMRSPDDNGVFSVEFAPDGRSFLAGGNPAFVTRWRVDPTLDDLIAWTRANRFVPDPTCIQRQLYYLLPLCQ
jgi:WD40 repeat protein/serine/threonine protein kinase